MNGELRRIRERKALSRRDLASLSGVDESTIYRFEHGRTTQVRPSTIRRLASALGVQPEQLTSVQAELGLRTD